MTGSCGLKQVGKTLKQDPRMELMQTRWFQDKDVLDIGCNEGHVTIALGTIHYGFLVMGFVCMSSYDS